MYVPGVLKTGLNVPNVEVDGLTPTLGVIDQLSIPEPKEIKFAVAPAHKVEGDVNSAFAFATNTVI